MPPVNRPTQKQRRAAKDRQYTVRRRVFLAEHPTCAAALPDLCTGQATQVHHRRGRVGADYLDETTWMGACLRCHMWIEAHRTESFERGWALPRNGVRA